MAQPIHATMAPPSATRASTRWSWHTCRTSDCDAVKQSDASKTTIATSFVFCELW